MLDNINNIKDYKNNNFFLIAGPCVIEDEETTVKIAKDIINITNRLKINLIRNLKY